MSEDDRDGERVVRCPIEGCTAEKLARGMHLHILRSNDAIHGDQGEYPKGVDLEDLEEVGRQSVTIDYPEDRFSESVSRLCPYCSAPFSGKGGVMRHLGLVEGRKDHPPNAADLHEPEDLAAVQLDGDENVVEVVKQPTHDGRVTPADTQDSEGLPSARFSKSEIAYLCEMMGKSNIDDQRLRLLLQQKFLQSLDRDS